MEDYAQWDKLKDKLKELTGLGYYNSGKSELICRCPLPGCEIDDKKTYSYGRLYIHTSTPVFNCFRCNQSGTIFKLLKHLQLPAQDYLNLKHEAFEGLSKGVKKLNTSEIVAQNIVEQLHIPDFSDRYKSKIMYVKGRMGMDTDVLKIPNIIFNIREFIEKNNIELQYHQKQMVDVWEQNYVGFVGNRGMTLVLRNIQGDDYHKVNVIMPEHFKDFYGLWTNEQHSGQTNKIVLCEGIFDLLVGIKSGALSPLRESSCFWAAALGSHYRGLVMSALDYMRLTYVDVIILSDRDKRPESKLYQQLRELPVIRNLEIYWNEYGQDFGQLPINPIHMVYKPQRGFSSFRKRPKKKADFR